MEIIQFLVIVAGIVIVVIIHNNSVKKEEQQETEKKIKLAVEKEEKQIEREHIIKSTFEKYFDIRKKNEISENCLKVSYLDGVKILKGPNFIWVNDNKICFFPSIDCIDLYFMSGAMSQLNFVTLSINIYDIISFSKEGEIFHETKMSGGGGGGSSIGKAIFGGIIAGGAGAIVASRKKTEAIKSELITHDERTCCLTYLEKNTKQIMLFGYSDYKIFKELIPEKDISVIDEIRRRNVIDKQTTPQTDNIQKIRDLGTLRDEGILTQEEFDEKKKELLKKV